MLGERGRAACVDTSELELKSDGKTPSGGPWSRPPPNFGPAANGLANIPPPPLAVSALLLMAMIGADECSEGFVDEARGTAAARRRWAQRVREQQRVACRAAAAACTSAAGSWHKSCREQVVEIASFAWLCVHLSHRRAGPAADRSARPQSETDAGHQPANGGAVTRQQRQLSHSKPRYGFRDTAHAMCNRQVVGTAATPSAAAAGARLACQAAHRRIPRGHYS